MKAKGTGGLKGSTGNSSCVCENSFMRNPLTDACECPPGYRLDTGVCVQCAALCCACLDLARVFWENLSKGLC